MVELMTGQSIRRAQTRASEYGKLNGAAVLML